METQQAIHTRRSVRAWTDDPVSDEHLETLLRAAMQAPNSDNSQPWHFIIVRDKSKLQAMADLNKDALMAPKAKIGILICAELALERSKGWWMQDCSAAVENMLLTAVDLGLGAVWTGIYHPQHLMDGARKIFHLPEGVEPHSLVLVGHAAKTPPPRDRFRPERIHQELW